jgi:tRNA nucleotidyltransferase (CCA-adding enzyme)
LLAHCLILGSGVVQQRMELYLNHLRHVKSALTGDDLIKAGFNPGPALGNVLEKLKEARLEGRVSSLEDELTLLKQIGRAEQSL